MSVDEFFRVRARVMVPARSVEADPAHFGVLSTGEACAVALLIGRLDLLERKFGSKHPLDALERLGPEWDRPVRDLHQRGWRE